MDDLRQIFVCGKCGEVDGEVVEVIDMERDDIEYQVCCSGCGGYVVEKTENGLPCYHENNA